MTRERDIERVLERWFADGPSEMPDRLFDNVVDRIEHVSQSRLARFQPRLPTMSSKLSIAVALAAAVIVILVGVAVLGRPFSSVGTSPTPPVASPSTSIAADTSNPPDTSPPCESGDPSCLGDLAAGTYSSANMRDPFTFTVPPGWSNSMDFSVLYALERSADYHLEPAFRDRNIGASIYLIPQPHPVVLDAECVASEPASVGSTAAELATWVGTHPGITTATPTTLAIGPLTAHVVDAVVTSDLATSCPIVDLAGQRLANKVPYVALIHGTTSGSNGWEFGPIRPEHQRFLFVDVGGGRVVAIVLDANPPDFDQLVADAMPIVQSMTFK